MLVSLEVFRRRRGAGPLPSGPAVFWFLGPLVHRPRTPGSDAPQVRRLPSGAHFLGLRGRPPGLASPSPAVLGSARPCSRQPPRCPGPAVRARLPAGSAGRRACPARPGCGPPGQTANMTLVSVNGSRSRPGPGQRRRPGWRCTVAYRLRSVTSPGKAGRPRVPALTDIAEMQPIRNAPETYPGGRDITANVALTCGDAPPRSWPGSAANPGKLH